MKLEIQTPKELSGPMEIPQRTLMGPGPSNCSPRVLRALGNQVLGHLHPETCQLMDEIKAGLRYVFQTRNRLTLAISASGHGGMEACLGNLVEPGETILIAKSGIWGDRAADMASRIGARVELLTTELGVAFTLTELESSMRKHRPAVVFVVHGESSTGMKQPLEGVADVVRKYDGLLIVDAVATLGGEPFYADAWGADAVYTGSQKCLSAPPGITPVTFSPRAETKIFNRKTKIPVYYWDMTLLGDYWHCFDRPRIYHHTISATLIYGLREALAILVSEGLEASWTRHAAAKRELHEGIVARGLEFYVKDPSQRLTTVTAVKIPIGIRADVITRRSMERCNVEIGGGLGPTAGEILRIGLMGVNATRDHVRLVLEALDEGIRFGRSHKL